MDRERLLTVAVVFLLILNVAMVAFLFIRKPLPPPRPELFKIIVRELQFSESQKEIYLGLRDEHHHQMEELDGRFREIFNVYLDQLKSHPEGSLRDSLENQMGLIEKSKASITLEHFQKVKEICNEDQKKKFNELIPEISRFINRPREQRPPR
jgi:protein CpxP